jgi:hypothetical protein
MKKSLLLLFVAVLALVSGSLYAACGPSSSGPCLIKGQVLDAVTKKPVSGVMVYALISGATQPLEVVTDCDGFYFFSQLPSDKVKLRFEKKGYQKYKYQNEVSVVEKKTVKIDVEVSPDASSELLPDDSEYPLLRILGLK